MKVHTKNEYSKLKSVIVGRPDYYVWPKTGDIFYERIKWLGVKHTGKPPDGSVPDFIIKEANEDLYAFIDLLGDEGVEVHRPEKVDWRENVTDYRGTRTGHSSYSARDVLLTIGDMVIECPTPFLSKQHLMTAYQSIKNEAIADGCRWIAAPQAQMEDAECTLKADHIQLTERYPIFDAANILKFNDKLVYLISATGNYTGAKWLQKIVGTEFEVIVWDNIYFSSHIDSTIMPLNENTILCNYDRVTGENLPKFLKSYQKIWVHDCVPRESYKFPHATKWLGMNVLSTDPETVFVDYIQNELIARLIDARFRVIKTPLRHSRTLSGGFHCVTCDLEREC